MAICPTVERTDAELIAAVLEGNPASFETLVVRYQPRVFATARRYARREGDAPFEHWLMRLAVRTCYDFLRAHQRNRETPFTELGNEETDWLDRFASNPADADEHESAARTLIHRILDQLSPSARLIITLLELEDRTMKEIASLTGWSIPAIKVRAFRARAEMKSRLKSLARDKYL
jgi:RNA polymerase sigma-70 factor (ECF subfamily)